ncbi:MAG: M23 family metallopeptidase [Chloroflexi bacterium]|nr:M23 family metallopeptidase [Chloroflexota bacterium]
MIGSLVFVSVTMVAAIIPGIDLPGRTAASPPEFPAPPGYLLPWGGGQIYSVTQGEDTTFTHNGAAAYALDLSLTYDTVVAARSGRVTMVRQDSNAGGCTSEFSGAANYVVIDHGDGTSSLYLHLAYNGVTVKPGDLVAQGQPIAIAGETGLTCSGEGTAPGPHLHYQVERTEPGQYFTQSLPIAFDDIPRDNGVAKEGQSYMSGNYGRGRLQKIKLTPYRVPRVFNPVAVAGDPGLLEAKPEPTPAPPPTDAAGNAPDAGAPSGTGIDTPVAPDVPPSPETSNTPRPTRTSSVTPTPTETETPTPTPSPATQTPPAPPTAQTPSPVVSSAASPPPSTPAPVGSSAGVPSAVPGTAAPPTTPASQP